jgi:formylglycine-generating enzyme required for sulfatase activity
VLSADEECSIKSNDGFNFKECINCPQMVVVPAGTFLMGSREEGRERDNEDPQHQVIIDKAFAVGKYHVTVGEFAAFMAEQKYDAGSRCFGYESRNWLERAASWRNPGFPQSDQHPVVCVNWNDAKAYVDWLSRKTQKPYRLLTEAEWEYAARAGRKGLFVFGDDENDACQYGKVLDRVSRGGIAGADAWPTVSCNPTESIVFTAPVGKFKPNAFGLYDMIGNAWQWTEDCRHDNYNGAPTDGSAWKSGDCGFHLTRGGSWEADPKLLRAAARRMGTVTMRNYVGGFRVARSLAADR